MKLIEELKNYCEIDNPVGTLMLSGEWGCGKTYLINNVFIPHVKDKYIIVCISLFGIDSLDALKVEVKKKWIEKATEIDALNGVKISKIKDYIKNMYGTVKDVLPQNWQKKGEVVSSIIDLINFMPIRNKISEKKVILVFDDLERCNISSTDLLGCINDYCENQKFNTIIVANEEKIKDSVDDNLSYYEIKEKIVQRIISFVPDYSEVVTNSIESMSCCTAYKELLIKNKKLLVKILSGDFNDDAIIEQYKTKNHRIDGNKKTEEYLDEEEKLRNLLVQRPHNIRSFKCAIQDFERVYNKLVKAGIYDTSNWLLTFTCFMMTNKAGLIDKSLSYGNIFLYSNVKKLYPEMFDSNFISNGFSNWIINGEWNEEVIDKELKLFLKKSKANTPLEILKTHDFPTIDEEIIYKGFKDLLKEAYGGKLSLDEYILFIEHCCYSREYDIDLSTIDWQKVEDGIRKKINELFDTDVKSNRSHRMIGDDNKKHFTNNEWSAYQIIKEFRDNDVWIYKKNQKLYIDLISSDLNVAFKELSNKRYNVFSLEMEYATISAFKNANNKDKFHFSGWFVGIWGQYHNLPGFNVQDTTTSLKKLKDDLCSLMQEYKEKNKNIAAKHTQYFINKLDDIIKPESRDISGE